MNGNCLRLFDPLTSKETLENPEAAGCRKYIGPGQNVNNNISKKEILISVEPNSTLKFITSASLIMKENTGSYYLQTMNYEIAVPQLGKNLFYFITPNLSHCSNVVELEVLGGKPWNLWD